MDPVSAIASVIGIIGGIAKTYEIIDKIVGLPKAFDEVKKDLPLVQSILNDAQESLSGSELPAEQSQAIMAVIKPCSDKAKELQRIFDEVKAKFREDEDAKDWAVVRGVYRKAVRGIKAYRVEALMDEILKGLKKLALGQVFSSTIRKGLKAIETAIEELAKVEPSLADSEFDGPGTIHASQNVEHGATGQQNNSQGNNNTFNSGKYVTSGTGHTFNFVEYGSAMTKEEIIGSLFKVTYEDRKDRNEERVDGTCQWFINHQFFRAWQEKNGSAFLWVSADPGCGKSVLAKYLIDDVLPSACSPQSLICYFFFKEDFEDQRSPENALCCILHQIFFQRPDLLSAKIFKEFEQKKEEVFNSFSSLWGILLDVSLQLDSGQVVCVLDALDECNDSGRSVLAKALTELYRSEASRHNVKFLVTSRPYWNIRSGFQDLKSQHPSIHLNGDEDEAIASQISQEINMVIEFKTKRLCSNGSITQNESKLIQNKLLDPLLPNRTYLWVYLVFGEIQHGLRLTRNDLEQTISNLPNSVSQAYEKILSKARDVPRTRKLIHIVLAARQPLSLHQMAVAMAIDAQCRSYDELESELEPESRFREVIREMCGLLVVVRHSKIYFLHQTAREFLIGTVTSEPSSSTGLWQQSFAPMESHCILADACISVLLASGFSATKRYQYGIFQLYAEWYWPIHFREADIKMRDAISRALPLLTEAVMPFTRRFIATKEKVVRFTWTFSPLTVASYMGLVLLVEQILQTEKGFRPTRNGRSIKTALYLACQEGHVRVVELLLKPVSRLEVWTRKISLWPTFLTDKNPCGESPLMAAARGGHIACMKLLLGHGAKVDYGGIEGLTPLVSAAESGGQAAVQFLLDNGAKVNIDKQVLTALMGAASTGQEAIVRLLLQWGANADLQNKNGGTALIIAAWYGHEAVVRLLLEAGANVDLENDGALIKAVLEER
ncbi:hypothetical protein AK830_g8241 [Neonectria ditissima]|uniref:Uncharacterized protein n=1 Tax=Neonectria ditissima TaxID=78410 RepID=A0A0P7AUY2_9HYPO|nr:hypothetical protein AK830_g8241 [Neonectria ditissima]